MTVKKKSLLPELLSFSRISLETTDLAVFLTHGPLNVLEIQQREQSSVSQTVQLIRGSRTGQDAFTQLQQRVAGRSLQHTGQHHNSVSGQYRKAQWHERGSLILIESRHLRQFEQELVSRGDG